MANKQTTPIAIKTITNKRQTIGKAMKRRLKFAFIAAKALREFPIRRLPFDSDFNCDPDSDSNSNSESAQDIL